ncbi:sensor histidine kinase [Sorangium sp. So ce131]|uniref:sensor histidine kinase n=1 Tax=Sorangium sp. So ce131 TaxID=3133282 RepID=UPI003F600A4E
MDVTEPPEPFAGLSPQEKAAAIFREADFEVEQRVGVTPGTVDWFAVPRTGFIRPRTYFRALTQPPEDPDAVLAELEAAREATEADRAVAIIMAGSLPRGYEPDLARRRSNLLTFRRWIFEILDVRQELQGFVQSHERSHQGAPYLPRRARLDSGETVQVEPYIDAWAQAETGPSLILGGHDHESGEAVLWQALYRAAVRHLKEPDTSRPLLISYRQRSLTRLGILLGLLIPAIVFPEHFKADELPPGVRSLRLDDFLLHQEAHSAVTLHLLPPSADEIDRWFEQHIEDPTSADRMRTALRSNDDFRSLARRLPNLPFLLKSIQSRTPLETNATTDAWIASVVAAYVEHVIDSIDRQREDNTNAWIQQAALLEFALGSYYIGEDAANQISYYGWTDEDGRRFTNNLVRDCLIAREITRDVRAGNEEILLRYQLPHFVFLFLTVIAPEIAARLTANAIGRMEQKIQEEVERKLHLTFAHHLNRPVGAMRQCVEDLREGLTPEQGVALGRPLSRLEEEISYLGNLAERTRLWQDEPTGTREAIAAGALADEVLAPLRQRYPAVSVDLDIPMDLRISALREALREALHCLLENAFHAAVAASRRPSPRVAVRAYRLGENIRIEVRDNGAGVDPGDRERIFEPLVTTKTGGAGKPRGTGLGLAIARRYVECMGGRLGLDPGQEDTCFFVDLVAWREAP